MERQTQNSARGPRAARASSLASHAIRLAIVALGLLVGWPNLAAAQGSVIPTPRQVFLTNAGAPCNGCVLYTYVAGSVNTDLATYSDVTLTTELPNPITMNSAGRPQTGAGTETNIYLSQANYKFVLQTSAGVTIWTSDHVPAIPAIAVALDVTGTAGEALLAGEVVYLSDAATGCGATAGRWYKADADSTCSSSTAGMVGIAPSNIDSAGSGSIRLSGRITGLSALTAGEKYYISATAGALTATPPTNARYIAQADSTTSVVVGGNPGSVCVPDSNGTHSLCQRTSSDLTADRLITYAFGDAAVTFDQAVATTSAPTFATVDTGQGANELYDMDQNVLTTSAPSFNQFRPPQGRLTLTTATPVTTADVTAATTLYYALYGGNQITLYDGSTRWVQLSFTELSLTVPATTNTMYDVFIDYTAGTPALEAVAWTNDTTRATALALQNGVYVQTSDTDSLYVGSFRTTGVSGQTEDSFAKRYVWNYYNRVPRLLRVLEATNSWTYTTATIRQANGAAGNQLDVVVGVAEVQLSVSVIAHFQNDMTAGADISIGIGEDSTTTSMTGVIGRFRQPTTAGTIQQFVASVEHYPAIGRHFYAWLEYSQATGTTTWYGDQGGVLLQSGIHGSIEG